MTIVRIREIEGYLFAYLCNIKPEINGRGVIKKYKPQTLYRNISDYPFNKYGKGTFCRFRIPIKFYTSGVYALYVDDELKYIGETINLSDRFNTGYGQISPRNCYQGGQETNCRINKMIFREAKKNKRIALCFHNTKRHKLVESRILELLKPPWNR